MFGIDPKAARAAWTVFLLALVIAIAYTVRLTLVVFMAAIFVAYILTPLVDVVERFTPRVVSRTAALAIVYLTLLAALVVLAITLGGQIGDQANSLAGRLPDLLKNQQWIEQIPLPAWMEPMRIRLTEWLHYQIQTGGSSFLPYLRGVGSDLLSGAKYLIYVILIPILAFLFLKDGRAMRDSILDTMVDGRQRELTEEILSDINLLLIQYIRAIVLLVLSSFLWYALFLSVTGAQYSVLLALIAGLFDFIPVIGPLAAGVLIFTITGLTGYGHLIAFVIFWGVLRLFQDYVLGPYLMGSGVELDPLVVLFGVLAGEQIAGIPGMFFSVPILASLRVIFVRMQRARARRTLRPSVAEPPRVESVET